jgi:hypothetical protein
MAASMTERIENGFSPEKAASKSSDKKKSVSGESLRESAK